MRKKETNSKKVAFYNREPLLIMSGEVPTLLPEWSKSYRKFYKSPTNGVNWDNLAHSYYGVVEEHINDVVKEIDPFVEDINRHQDNNINGYQFGSKPVGKGQFSYVYKATKNNGVYSVKIIPKKPLNSQQYSMNQVLRQLQTWRMKGYLPPLDLSQNSVHSTSDNVPLEADISADETMMLMNLQKCRREILVLVRLSKLDKQLERSNLVRFFKVLDSPISNNIYMIGEWCDLGELKWKRSRKDVAHTQWNAFHPNVTVEQFVMKAFRDISSGLRFMKLQGCIHRDIKPSNILLDARSGTLKISDFGCCIITPEQTGFFSDVDPNVLQSSFSSELNKIVGTPAFIAPELCNFKTIGNDHNGNMDNGVSDGFKLDVWSLGVTMFCLLHNELPFIGDNEFDTYNQIIERNVNNYRNGDRLNDFVINRLLEKNWSRRIDIDEITNELKNWGLMKNDKVNRPKKESGIRKMWKSFFKKKDSKKVSGNDNSTLTPLQQSSHFIINDLSRGSDKSFVSQSMDSTSSFEDPVPITDFLDHYENNNPPISENVITLANTNEVILPSATSPSPIKIDTPIKDLIRINNSPYKEVDSPTKNKRKQPVNKMKFSKEIMDFRQFVDQPDDSKISSNTLNNINLYLNSNSHDICENP